MAEGSATGEGEDDIEAWKQLWEKDQAELVRSERVTQQLTAVLQSLQNRCNELQAERDRLAAKMREDERLNGLEHRVEEARDARRLVDGRREDLAERSRRLNEERGVHERREEECRAQLADVEARRETAEIQLETGIEQLQAAEEKVRSMVMAEALDRTKDEAEQIRIQVTEQEAEAARLREALVDSWARRVEEPEQEGAPCDDLESLDGLQEQLEWLAKMQQTAAAEVHNLQKLERSEAALHAQLREASEEKAALHSARVDLGDSGRTMREAIATQSETYVERVGKLEEAKRLTDADRTKLINECAGMQARLDAMTPMMAGLSAVEDRHNELSQEREALTEEGARLRAVNAALGAQLLGQEAAVHSDSGGGAGAVSEALNRVLQLQQRFIERRKAHDQERQRLADRIRALERDNAGAGPLDVAAAAPNSGYAPERKQDRAAPPLPAGIASAATSATSALMGGFGRLRDAALPAR